VKAEFDQKKACLLQEFMTWLMARFFGKSLFCVDFRESGTFVMLCGNRFRCQEPLMNRGRCTLQFP